MFKIMKLFPNKNICSSNFYDFFEMGNNDVVLHGN